MEISRYEWPPSTRACRFSLCLQGGCVFADFNLDQDGRVYLERISYDGYGCCSIDGEVERMPLDDSRSLMKLVNADDVDRDEAREILYRYFHLIKDEIWSDALEEHGLLKR